MGNGKLNIFFYIIELFITWNKFFSGNYQYPRFIFETFCAKIGEYNNRKSHPASSLYFTIPEAKKVLKKILTNL